MFFRKKGPGFRPFRPYLETFKKSWKHACFLEKRVRGSDRPGLIWKRLKNLEKHACFLLMHEKGSRGSDRSDLIWKLLKNLGSMENIFKG